jgi:hypothetical protein
MISAGPWMVVGVEFHHQLGGWSQRRQEEEEEEADSSSSCFVDSLCKRKRDEITNLERGRIQK